MTGTLSGRQQAEERRRQKRVDKRADDANRSYEARQRTPGEQLKRLDWRLGKGQGAVKERARIAKQLTVTEQ